MVDDDFYVGYQPKAPAGLAAWMRRAVIGLGLVATALALILVSAQEPFAASSFEFGKTRSFEVFLEERPYPSLVRILPDGNFSRQLLTVRGKFGAETAVMGADGKQVSLEGSLISRGGRSMIEIEPDRIRMLGGRIAGMEPPVDLLGMMTLRGEIVDGKCWLGVMNPGSGKVHQDCAVRCLSGGTPPLFVSGDEVYVLTGPDGRGIGRQVARLAARRVEIRGEAARSAGTMFLKADPASLRIR